MSSDSNGADNNLEQRSPFAAASSRRALVRRAAAAVTPSSPVLRRGQCAERSRSGGGGWCCHHHKARYQQLCQNCNRSIRLDDCIVNYHGGGGWVHARCEGDENRGLASLQNSLRPSVARRRLEFGTTDTIDSSGRRPRKRLKFGEDEPGEDDNDDDDANDEEEEEKEEEEAASEAEEDANSSVGSYSGDDGEGCYDPESRYTREQQAIASYCATEPGELVHINALAGCGKTTTIALLCCRLLEREPGARILYLVFGNRAMDSARTSGHFPKAVEIRTTHSLARRKYFGPHNMSHCIPVDQYTVQDIVDQLSLTQQVKQTFPDLKPSKRRRIAATLARYVRRTLARFWCSKDQRVTEDHVFWLATKPPVRKSAQWRKHYQVQDYVDMAQRLWRSTWRKCQRIRDGGGGGAGGEHRIPHDAYLKVAQVEGLDVSLSSYNYIAIDEAQDMTACQADLFWGSERQHRNSAAIFLVGDEWQQLYRFRGASTSFARAAEKATRRFSLTGSFRFGPPIAAAASSVLHQLAHGRQALEGLCEEPCAVVKDESTFQAGVAVCRSNNGMYGYLLHNRPARWCFLEEKRNLPTISTLHSKLERFLWGEEQVLKHREEVFENMQDIEDYLEDADDVDFRTAYYLLKTLQNNKKRIAEFCHEIKLSHVSLDGHDPNEYDGIILTTVHGAKGLEFDNVFIHSDFGFERLMEMRDRLAYSRISDEANMIYVATTRARKNLFLSEPAFLFLESLGAFRSYGCQEPLTPGSLKAERRAWEVRWKEFEEDKGPIRSCADIPWPDDGSSDNPLLLDSKMSEELQKNYIYKLIRRFHTDKFSQRFRSRLGGISKEEWTNIKRKLDEYASKATEMLQVLRTNENGDALMVAVS